jgi:hypothetical protein
MVQNLKHTVPTAAATGEQGLRAAFKSPPREFGPVPFWWWVGDPLDRERLAWQLDQLQAKGVYGAIISYNHDAAGRPVVGDPPVFSAPWWELFKWLVQQCSAREMTIGLQDYSILAPMLETIARSTPGMMGGSLQEASATVQAGQACCLQPPEGCAVIAAHAVCTDEPGGPPLNLAEHVSDGVLRWQPAAGHWTASLVYLKPGAFDPLHPSAGEQVIKHFFEPFESHCPGEVGRTIRWFFQDELDFGVRMPMWSPWLFTEFKNRKGYELPPVLTALWHDIGPRTQKVRVDYADVVTTLLEERYFIPIYRWHEARGTVWGNDNIGRGGIAESRRHYGDYFRTMRWFTAPGTDDPNLTGPRNFKGLKVNSSIANMYSRPRVWNESFHSSGWGASPGQMIAALHQDFVYGATVVNLHGLYYSTHGSWWEWAAPDFHFRQPYWQHMEPLNAYSSRLSYMLSRGTHVCDVAMVYPITALEGGLNAHGAAPAGGDVSYSEQQRGVDGSDIDEAERDAFGLGRQLVERGIDFDFVDFESVAAAHCEDGRLAIRNGSYRVLILPGMSTIRFGTLQKAHAFAAAGGMVIAIGALPGGSERAGRDDAEVRALVEAIFGDVSGSHTARRNLHSGGGCGIFIPGDYAAVSELITRQIVRDFDAGTSPLQVTHRQIGDSHAYFIFNPAAERITARIVCRALGQPELWDAWTGTMQALPPAAVSDDGTALNLTFDAQEAKLIVFGAGGQASDNPPPEPLSACRLEEIALAGPWDFSLKPTMDNRFGDFWLPATADAAPADTTSLIGPEARRFRYAVESDATVDAGHWHEPQLDDSDWPLTSYAFGPRFWRLGPLPPQIDSTALEQKLAELSAIDPSVPLQVDGHDYFWQPHVISLRWGVENDPFLKHWSSGPHGLKGRIPDEYIDLHCDTPGASWYLWTCVQTSADRQVPVMAGSRSAYKLWLNGSVVLEQSQALEPGVHPQWNLPHYDSQPRQCRVTLRRGENPMVLKLVQPAGQRVRAYAAIDPPEPNDDLALRWFSKPSEVRFNYMPQQRSSVGWYRFLAPPGLASVNFAARGATKVWVNGKPVKADLLETGSAEASVKRYRVEVGKPCADAVVVAMRIVHEAGSYAGDALPEPVRMQCGSGRIHPGDWSPFGLATYSGMAIYRRQLHLTQAQIDGGVVLDLGAAAVTASVWVNGRHCGTLVGPPWRLDISQAICQGNNLLEIQVTNTLANHYSAGIPTPYAWPEQTISGLLGPVRLIIASAAKSETNGCPA